MNSPLFFLIVNLDVKCQNLWIWQTFFFFGCQKNWLIHATVHVCYRTINGDITIIIIKIMMINFHWNIVFNSYSINKMNTYTRTQWNKIHTHKKIYTWLWMIFFCCYLQFTSRNNNNNELLLKSSLSFSIHILTR